MTTTKKDTFSPMNPVKAAKQIMYKWQEGHYDPTAQVFQRQAYQIALQSLKLNHCIEDYGLASGEITPVTPPDYILNSEDTATQKNANLRAALAAMLVFVLKPEEVPDAVERLAVDARSGLQELGLLSCLSPDRHALVDHYVSDKELPERLQKK